MRNLLAKIDWILVPRLLMGGAMCVVGYQTSDTVSGGFGLLFVIYAIIGSRYKIGCGYNACGYTPKRKTLSGKENIEFTEIK